MKKILKFIGGALLMTILWGIVAYFLSFIPKEIVTLIMLIFIGSMSWWAINEIKNI